MRDNSIKYAAKQAMTAGIPTLVLMLVLNFFMNKTAMNLEAIVTDLPLTILITGLVCTFVQTFLIKGPAKKGLLPEITSVSEQAAYVLIPKNTAVFIIMISIMATLLFACAPIGLLHIFMPDVKIGRMLYVIAKALVISFAASYVTFHANMYLGSLYQEMVAVNSYI